MRQSFYQQNAGGYQSNSKPAQTTPVNASARRLIYAQAESDKYRNQYPQNQNRSPKQELEQTLFHPSHPTLSELHNLYTTLQGELFANIQKGRYLQSHQSNPNNVKEQLQIDQAIANLSN